MDDTIFGSVSDILVEEFVNHMKSEFEMSLVGELNYFLGLQVKQLEDGIFVSQSKYAKNLIQKFKLETSKVKRTTLGTTVKITTDEEGTCVDQSLYRSMIGSFLYLAASRPDISFSAGICARYQSNPKESHLTAVKNIKYVKGTSEYNM